MDFKEIQKKNIEAQHSHLFSNNRPQRVSQERTGSDVADTTANEAYKMASSNQRRLDALISKFNEMVNSINKLEKRVDQLELRPASTQQRSFQSGQSDTGRTRRDPTKPIDRNNVPPEKVNIGEIFYFGKK